MVVEHGTAHCDGNSILGCCTCVAAISFPSLHCLLLLCGVTLQASADVLYSVDEQHTVIRHLLTTYTSRQYR